MLLLHIYAIQFGVRTSWREIIFGYTISDELELIEDTDDDEKLVDEELDDDELLELLDDELFELELDEKLLLELLLEENEKLLEEELELNEDEELLELELDDDKLDDELDDKLLLELLLDDELLELVDELEDDESEYDEELVELLLPCGSDSAKACILASSRYSVKLMLFAPVFRIANVSSCVSVALQNVAPVTLCVPSTYIS